MKRLSAAIALLLIAAPASAQVTISGLPSATGSLVGSEVIPIVQGGTTRQASAAQIARSVTKGAQFSATGGIGSATSTYSGGEPVGGTYSVNGSTGVGIFANIAGSGVNNTGVTTIRPLGDRFHDLNANVLDFGAKGGATDDGAATASAVAAAQANGVPLVFPYKSGGYTLNFTPPGFSYSSNGTTYSDGRIMLGDYRFAGNKLAGTAIGDITTPAGATFNSEYTNPHNQITWERHTADPAGFPLRNGGIVGSSATPLSPGVTSIGYSWECAPNRPNPLASDSVGNPTPNLNWAACTYIGASTGKGGAPGTSLPMGLQNQVLSMDENAGTATEIDINADGAGVKDGGITRGIYISGGGNPANAANFSAATVALDITHGDYAGNYMAFGAGVSIHSSVTSLELWKDVANEYGYAIQLLDGSNGNAQLFVLDKNGYTSAIGYRTFPSAFSSLAACTSSNDGSQRAITDGPASPSWGQTITAGGGSQHMLLYCDGSNWTVMAK